jgi:dTDP-4-amino-4,6-dideoxygalactose transaminase
MSESIRLPNTEKQVSEILSLPIYPGLKKTTVKEITNLIGEVY